MLNTQVALTLHAELSVLSRAIAYQNLTEASSHIGVSQPQLSRVLSKLEKELKVQLLDRTAKRKSGWTMLAFRLSEFYQKFERRFERDLTELVQGMEVSQLRIGTLEGLSHLALRVSKSLLALPAFDLVECDIHDLDELDRMFLKGELDMIFTVREPSRRKYRYTALVGYQDLKWFRNDAKTLVLSSHQYGSGLYKKWKINPEKMFISNSLELRKFWLAKYDGTGVIPSSDLKATRGKTTDEESVYLIANDLLSENLWKQTIKLLN